MIGYPITYGDTISEDEDNKRFSNYVVWLLKKLTIDKEVSGNRVAVVKFVKKVYGKRKVIVISTTLGILILVSIPKNAEGIGVPVTPPSPAPIMRHSTEVVPSYARLSVEKQDKITFLKNERVPQTDQIYSDLSENLISTVDKIVLLRGGGMSPQTKALFRLILIWAIGQGYTPTEGFQPGQINPGFGHPGQVGTAPRITPNLQENPLNRNNPGQGSCGAKQNNQDGTLTSEQKRNLPSPDDVIISEQNVIIRDGQSKYKIKNHGHEFGIESTQNSKGKFKTEKTPENIQAFKDEIKNLVLNGE